MGLDWCLQSLEEGKSPLEMLGAQRCDPANPAHVKIVQDIIKSHLDHIQKDPDGCRPEYIAFWERSEASIVENIKGEVLVDSIPKEKMDEFIRDGVVPAFGNPFSVMTGITAFRGKRISYCDLLPEDVRDDAYNDKDAEGMLDYANVLEEYLPDNPSFDYDTEKAKYDKLGMFDEDRTIPEMFYDVSAIKEACAWLRFWAKYPVKMVAWA